MGFNKFVGELANNLSYLDNLYLLVVANSSLTNSILSDLELNGHLEAIGSYTIVS